MIIDFRPEIRISTSWDEAELQSLDCSAFQLYGYSYSNEKVKLEFRQLERMPELTEQMLFEMQGELFYCDEIEYIASKGLIREKFDLYRGIQYSTTKEFDLTITGRVVSRC